MSHYILILTALIAATTVYVHQRAALNKVQRVNVQLAAQTRVLNTRLVDLRERGALSEQRLAQSKERLEALRQNLHTAPAPKPAAIVPPDPDRHGGWPAKTPYFYLPKKTLNAVGYRLFAGHRLTDDAATLFGMTPAEREAVDTAYNNLWQKFREFEIQRMELTEKPPQWQEPVNRDSISYRIPSLAKESGELLVEFTTSLQSTLGATRTGYLMETAQAYLTSQLEDLGQTARVITFWPASSDGQKPWYGILNEGINGTVRAIQSPLEPDSTEAYYARLFGIEVPIKE